MIVTYSKLRGKIQLSRHHSMRTSDFSENNDNFDQEDEKKNNKKKTRTKSTKYKSKLVTQLIMMMMVMNCFIGMVDRTKDV